ncbi:MAG: DUF4124 domain-containing protein [Candidatus Accumulibacter sp.]|jgi:hypothetical protein|nr:DUF4124 domain-containing protein [Accumulibacter sp.]
MPAKHSPFLPLLLAAALCVALPAGAQIYQWKDSSGKTVISDKPPAAGTPVEKKAGKSSPAPADSRQPSMVDRELEFRKRQLESREKAEKAEKEEAAAAERERNCRAARGALQSLESDARIMMRNEDGERYVLDKARRDQEIARVKQIIETRCE